MLCAGRNIGLSGSACRRQHFLSSITCTSEMCRAAELQNVLQERFYVGAGGNCPCKKPRPCPKNISAYRLGAKRSALWPSKYAKMHFSRGSASDPTEGAYSFPRSPSRLGRGHRSPYPPDVPPHSTPSALATGRLRRLGLGSGIAPNIFL